MGLITSPGAGSGLDVNSIITAILRAESEPITRRIQKAEAKNAMTLSGLGAFKSALTELGTALAKLDSESDFAVRKSSLSSTEYLSVTTTNSSSIASYDIEVEQLAAGSKRESGILAGGTSSTFGAGNLTFDAGTKSFAVSIEATDTLVQIRNKINSASGNFGVTASIVTTDTGTKLTYSSSVTGSTNGLAVTNNNAALNPISTATVETQPAADGKIRIDGELSTSETNTFTAITDLTIKAIKANVNDETTTVTVTTDSAGIKSSIGKLVEAFNNTLKTLRSLGSSVPGATGILVGDSSLRSAEARLRGLIGKAFNGADSSVENLASLGVTTNRDGSLSLDNDVLAEALSSNLDGVKNFFTQAGGFSAETKTVLDGYTGASGVLKTRESSLSSELDRLNQQKEALNLRLDAMEKRLRSQYAALDSIVSKFQGASSFLARSLSASTSKS